MKNISRRKSINYVGQNVAKDLFDAIKKWKESKTPTSKLKRTLNQRNKQKNKNNRQTKTEERKKVREKKVKDKGISLKNIGMWSKNYAKNWHFSPRETEVLKGITNALVFYCRIMMNVLDYQRTGS